MTGACDAYHCTNFFFFFAVRRVMNGSLKRKEGVIRWNVINSIDAGGCGCGCGSG